MIDFHFIALSGKQSFYTFNIFICFCFTTFTVFVLLSKTLDVQLSLSAHARTVDAKIYLTQKMFHSLN